MPIVSVHGIDASGKASQVAATAAALREVSWAAGFRIDVWDFPRYQSTMGEIIGRVLRGETLVVPDSALDDWPSAERLERSDVEALKKSWSLDKAHLIQAAMVVNRLEFLHMLQLGAKPDHLLILDRYILDAIVYGQVDGLDREWLLAIHACLPPSALNIVLDITVEESMRRRPERRDYYEKNTDKLAKVRQLYRDEVARQDNVPLPLLRVHGSVAPESQHVTLDGMQPQAAITADILQLIYGLVEKLPPIMPFG